MRVEHEICNTMCGTPVKAIWDHRNLTELAGEVREGQNMAKNGLNLALVALARVLDELERNQKKGKSISKMMSALVHVQLYTLSYRKAVIRPQNKPKTADWG